MPAAEAHPPPDLLRVFHSGQLAGPDADAIEHHISDCTECVARLLAQPDDPMLELARWAVCQAVDPGKRPPAKIVVDTAVTFIAGPDTDPGGAAAAPPDEVPPGLIDHPRYRVLSALGHGGMGAVYLAEHLKMGRKVALKVIRPGLLASAAALPRFRQEVKAAARLSHPNIVQAFDADEAGDLQFFVMEFVDGTDLGQLLRGRRGPLPVAEACEYIRQAALGLQHAHEQGMVHRDIKPQNLMVTGDGRVKVLDFGLAGFARVADRDESSQITGSGVVMGTADYIAPEQTRDAHTADTRADIYSLGCTLYQCLTGRVPFESGSVVEKMVRHAVDAPPPLAGLRPDLPAKLVRVVERMMAKRPEDRFRTPAEVAAALAPFATAAEVIVNVRPHPRVPRILAAGVIAFLAMLAVAAVVYRIQTDHGEIVITSQSDDVEVVISKGGKAFTILDTKTKKKLTLPTGDYDLTLSGPDGFTLSTDKVTIRRGKEALLTIERVRKPAPAPKPTIPAPGDVPKVGFQRTITVPFDLPNPSVPVLSPDGSRVALLCNPTGGAGAGWALVWDTNTGELLRTIRSPERWFTSVSFLPDGRLLTVHENLAKNAYPFLAWDLATGKSEPVGKLPDFERWTNRVGTTPDGKYAWVRYFRTRDVLDKHRVTEIATGRVTAEIDPPAGVTRRAWHICTPDSKHLVTLDSLPGVDGEPRWEFLLHAVATGKVEHRVLVKGWSDIGALADGGKTLVVPRLIKDKGYAAEFIDVASGRSLRTQPFGPSEGLNAVGISPDGRFGVQWLLDQSVRFYDLADGKELYRSEQKFQPPPILFSQDGRMMTLGADSYEFHIFRLPDGAKQ